MGGAGEATWGGRRTQGVVGGSEGRLSKQGVELDNQKAF